MINPNEVTNFNRTPNELEEFLLFCIVVAGKNSQQQSVKLDKFLYDTMCDYVSPFNRITLWMQENILLERLKTYKIGQYTRILTAFEDVSFSLKDKLDTCTLEDLNSVKGIGPKTARFFLLHSRPNQNIAVLDTHILKWLGSKGHKVPKSTPSGKKYKELEDIFLSYCKEYNMTPSELDLKIWKEKGLTNSTN